jgi:hypothetical protein
VSFISVDLEVLSGKYWKSFAVLKLVTARVAVSYNSHRFSRKYQRSRNNFNAFISIAMQ